MEPGTLEHQLWQTGALLVDPRVLRRVVKVHRRLNVLGVQVPHTHCYGLDRDALLRIVSAAEIGVDPATLPAEVVLLPRPPPSELGRLRSHASMARLWRASFHAQVHLTVDRKLHRGELTEAGLRDRIARIGFTEFQEICGILRDDDHLLPPDGDRERYTEFAALYLELKHFAPGLLSATFPGVTDRARVEAVLAEDIDAHALLARSCPASSEPVATVLLTAAQRGAGTQTLGSALAPAPPHPPSPRAAAGLLRRAAAAKEVGNDVRAALLRAAAGGGVEGAVPTAGGPGEPVAEAVRQDLEALGTRLTAALQPPGAHDPELGRTRWASLLLILADQAARRRGLRYPVEARLLYDLQLAAIAHERGESAVDLATWALSRGKRPVVRPLEATRSIRVARHIREAAQRVRHTRIASADRKLLAKVLRGAAERAEENVRLTLRPKLRSALDEVGLAPRDVPEELGRSKLVEELLDQAVAHGFFTFGHLRDALSRNQLKLDDLSGPREWLRGDPLLQLDRHLAVSLDGVYRSGEIYLRGLQKLSSVPFGTRIGRALVLFLLLPFGASFVLLEGAKHLVNPLLGKLGVEPVPFETPSLDTPVPPMFVGLALVLLALIHVPLLRAIGMTLLRLTWRLLVLVLWRIPSWVLTLGAVRWVFERPAVRTFARRVLAPLAVTGGVYLLTPVRELGLAWTLVVTGLVFVVLSLAFSQRVAELFETAVFDWIAPGWRAFSHRVLPGMFRLVASFFRRLMDLLERGIYKVDELLRFRQGQLAVTLWAKAFVGLGWFVVAYAVRLYVTLLVEPEINPLKHVPVVTVAHKLMLPVTPAVFDGLQAALSALGPVVSGAIASVTAFLLPSVFGFLAWELKENWKLYRASRPPTLQPVALGPHGEKMADLLIPGLHSGTLPKLHQRLRRAAQREEESIAISHQQGEGARGSFREGIESVEVALRRFVDRELIALLTRSPRWSAGAILIDSVFLGSNRIRLRLTCPGLGPGATELAFEELSGLLVASVPDAGFLPALADRPGGGSVLFENALAGLYKLAGVDIVREQLAWALGQDAHYAITDEQLVVWPSSGYETELRYALRSLRPQRMLVPRVVGQRLQRPAPALDRTQVLFHKQDVPWPMWVQAWRRDLDTPPARLLAGPHILPVAQAAGVVVARPA